MVRPSAAPGCEPRRRTFPPMATRKLLISFGQSNGGAHPDYASWEQANPGLAVGYVPLSSNSPTGSSNDRITMPGTWPTRHQQAGIKGRGSQAIWLLTFFNPSATGLGYTQFPHRALISGIVAHDDTQTSISTLNVWQYDPTGRTIVRSSTGSEHTIIAWGGTFGPAFAGQISVSPPFDSPPAVGEQFEYPIYAGANSTSAGMVLFDMRFGGDFGDGVWRGSLAGMRARCTAGTNVGVSRSIDAITLNGSVKVEVSFMSNWPQVPQAGDRFVIEPHPRADGSAVDFDEWGLWLPWSPLEGQALSAAVAFASVTNAGGLARIVAANGLLTNDVVQIRGGSPYDDDNVLVVAADATGFTINKPFTATGTGEFRVYGKTNPYPPGFSFPNHHDIPPLYQPYPHGTFMYGPSAPFESARAAYYLTLANRMQEHFGERIYVASLAVDGTTIALNELHAPAVTNAIGWFDPRQQTSWSGGEPNGCLARLRTMLEAGKAAAEEAGDTLEVVGLFAILGEGDAAFDWSAARFVNSMRGLKSSARALVKDLGLWAGAEEEIPIVWPKIRVAAPWTFATTINDALAAECLVDPYMQTVEVSDLTVLTETGGNVHYDGESATVLATRVFDAHFIAAEGTDLSTPSAASETPDSTPQAIIAAIDAAMAGVTDVAAYTVNGRVVQLRTLSELTTARRYYEGILARQQGLRRTKVRFR